MKTIYEILNADILISFRLFAFYSPITITLITYARHKPWIRIVGLGLFSVPKGIILVMIMHSEKNLEK
jgi:hypothetical protein